MGIKLPLNSWDEQSSVADTQGEEHLPYTPWGNHLSVH